ncbi:MAG: aminomethyl-transferring glycine dehydrogenase [Deltaproteobacteria bacterium]|nr:aminomethyl-transferring glycine dehydrogenase [Deltaproteobacteria bacterium]
MVGPRPCSAYISAPLRAAGTGAGVRAATKDGTANGQATTALPASIDAARSRRYAPAAAAHATPTEVSMALSTPAFSRHDHFEDRHIGPREADLATMFEVVGVDSLDALLQRVMPDAIRTDRPLAIPEAASEATALEELRALAAANRALRSFYGQGYHGTRTPPVIRRNILENPGWYTQYTPYQAEISQGRLEMLLNFQTLVADLCGLPVAGASLLDEATAAAEAMAMMLRAAPPKSAARTLLLDAALHPQTIAVIRTRADGLGVAVEVAEPETWKIDAAVFGAVLATPTTDGRIRAVEPVAAALHEAGALLTVATDPLALVVQRAPGAAGADIVIGSMQRFGVPMGYGGPHAGFLACSDALKRQLPGRLIGVSVDRHGNRALRMALQTREQHIRRNKATSNICTAQVLLAIVAVAYAMYHGPAGLTAIASRIQRLTVALRSALERAGHRVQSGAIFDTVRVWPRGGDAGTRVGEALRRGLLLRDGGDGSVLISLDETVESADIDAILAVFDASRSAFDTSAASGPGATDLPAGRDAPLLPQECFHVCHSETDMLRLLARLQSRDLSLVQAMIPLGSCTMKLNATAEMEPITWAGFADVHPFAPAQATKGYRALLDQLSAWLCDITGFAACSMQPNAGSQGEYAGLLSIVGYHRARGEGHRDVCLIPTSAHGTNPASAVMAGLRVIAVQCDDHGNVDLDDLRAKCEANAETLAAVMVTYPSTHGVFESGIRTICEVVHQHGGQVYMDGANMNAMVGLARPGEIGADVCHLNLHKTFCIPHGGGGPGMGPICVAAHLQPYLPGHPATHADAPVGAVSAAPYGSPGILPIPWAYIRMMGPDGLRRATAMAILSANYIAARLAPHYPILFRGEHGLCAHECILDLRPLKKTSGVTVDDVAKRLIDYGFHAPTMSWPVAGTLMIEPTESEPRAELDRFCDAMIAIRAEIEQVEAGTWPADDNPLCNAPHTAAEVTASTWEHPYSREIAAFPSPETAAAKFWPAVARVDNAYGDRHLVCTCPTVEELATEETA